MLAVHSYPVTYPMLIKPKENIFLPVKSSRPPLLLPWLIYEDSLTELLQSKAGHTRLQVLGQQWEAADWWDRHVVQMANQTVFHREILMWAGQEACWYARTIIPETTYNAEPLFFNRLQNESLGELIFNETKIKRAYMTYYPIGEQSIEYHWLNKVLPCSAKELWVRLSAFTFKEDFSFFLVETVLPGLERYSK